MAEHQFTLPDGVVIRIPPGMSQSVTDDFLIEWNLAVNREQSRDEALTELDKVRGNLREAERERDALEEALAELRDALSPVSLGTKAMLDAIRAMRGQLDRAKRMLINHGYDVDTHGMDGGLRAALADKRVAEVARASLRVRIYQVMGMRDDVDRDEHVR